MFTSWDVAPPCPWPRHNPDSSRQKEVPMQSATVHRHQGYAMAGVARFVSRCATATLAVLMLFAFTGCTKPAQLVVPLDDHPTDHLNLTLLAGQLPTDPNFKMAVVVTDSRPDKSAIGQNIEDAAKPIPVQTGTSDPAAFLRAAVAKTMGDAGLTVVDQPSAATRVLTLDLKLLLGRREQHLPNRDQGQRHADRGHGHRVMARHDRRQQPQVRPQLVGGKLPGGAERRGLANDAEPAGQSRVPAGAQVSAATAEYPSTQTHGSCRISPHCHFPQKTPCFCARPMGWEFVREHWTDARR